MLTIDGSIGEGGGQVLRSSLALSIVTGTPVRLHSIRAKRSKPGLARQHLTAVLAAAAICGGTVDGAAMRSTEIVFRPGAVVPGDYTFSIGTAGSANLVLQTLLPPLMMASSPSSLTLRGGTHNSNSPPFHYLDRVFAPLLGRIGPSLELELVRWGFYPAGGGEIRARITPAPLKRLDLIRRGHLGSIQPLAVVSALPRKIGRRELQIVGDELQLGKSYGRVLEIDKPTGPGNVLMVEVSCEHATELFTGFGSKGVRAEAVARGVARRARAWIDADVPVGVHTADQLLLPMALAGGGRFRTLEPDPHTPTNAAIVQRFLSVGIEIEQQGGAWDVRIG